MELLDPGSVTSELARRVAQLDPAEKLTLVEAGGDSIALWTIRRDAAGTPQAFCRSRPWAELERDGRPDETELKRLADTDDTPIAICQPGAGAQDPGLRNQFLDWFQAVYPAAILVEKHTPADSLLRDALASVPLNQWYELAVLRTGQTGRPILSTVPLFPPGAMHDHENHFTVHCDADTEHGVSLAVLARDMQRYHLVSLESVQVPPGDYNLTAVLVRPGRVSIKGLPAPVRTDSRSWSEIIATIPDRIPNIHDQNIHLICVIEMSASQEQASERVRMARQLIELAGDVSGSRLAVSLVGYGTHSFARVRHDEPLKVWAWAAPIAESSRVFGDLIDHPEESAYPHAARLECALALLAGRVVGADGRPVVVAIGSRPPFPSRMDLATAILPCPERNDWKRALVRLGEHPGLRVGAITDNATSDAWRSMSRDALGTPAAFDAAAFAANLGLLTPAAVRVPFPMAQQPEADRGR